MWGEGSDGQLGHGTKTNMLYPEEIKQELENLNIKQVSCGGYHTVCITIEGYVYSWGKNSSGQLGQETFLTILQPKKILYQEQNEGNMYIPNIVKVYNQIKNQEIRCFYPIHDENLIKQNFLSQELVDIKLGFYHCIGLTNAGEIYVWGSNQYGQHGISSQQILAQYKENSRFIRHISSKELTTESFPTLVSFFDIKEQRIVTQIACGAEYCMAIENKRTVYAWGKNTEGQLGLGFVTSFVEQPSKLSTFEGLLMKQVECGENHSLFLTDSGKIYTCGSYLYGKLGLGQISNNQIIPQLIKGIENVEKIACGSNHSMALVRLQENGGNENNNHNNYINKVMILYTWGSGFQSKLGHGDQDDVYEPFQIENCSFEKSRSNTGQKLNEFSIIYMGI
ncbi:nd6 protein, putative [Ichthyophthirius multifiliis]|uniref:Nd6 protein, putative n=1 Tax=Ichthyophthirius multifiliis TaxID=5932 RepID=G0QJ10_ICHMU|nr:nd6 protein, putative [Ichthyophthirius multifiliis]EGR34803.1 nd6 protein, putative [Ichthyophthirius multifiliis]|eukprot:XP_004040107.1 nd6 protein, putative [Ichthyophthirius multifiliis]